MKRLLLISAMAGLLVCGECRMDPLTISNESYNGNELRMDGVYYNKPDKAHFFLYRNGVLLHGGSRFQGNLKSLANHYSDTSNYQALYRVPYFWGRYQVRDTSLVAEKWLSGDAFAGYATIKFDGQILNDSTLLIIDPVNHNETDTFYFYQMTKPDSTNEFTSKY